MPTVADVLVEGLLRAGVSRLFAAGRSALLDAARRHDLPVALAASDLGAGLMAAVTGERGGAPGAWIARDLSAAAAVLAYARAEWAPLVALTEREAGHSAPGEMPFAALAKQSLRVEAASAAHWVAHASRLARAEPPGPVHLDVTGATAAALPVATRATPDTAPPPDTGALDRAAELIARAQRPLVLAGRGTRGRDTVGWLRAFAEALPAPVLVTPKARGVMPDPHPLALGTMGPATEVVVRRADLIVAIGLEPIELPRHVPVVRLAAAVSENELAPAVQVIGDLTLVLEELAPRLRDSPRADWDVAELDRLKRARVATDGDGLAARVTRLARELSPAGTVAAMDAGPQTAALVDAWEAVQPGELLASSVLGLPGIGLPAAIAAQLDDPTRRVLCFATVSSMLPVLGELATAARTAPAPIVIVLPDAAPHMATLDDVAGSLGVGLVSALDGPSFARALDAALRTPGPTLIRVAGRSLAFGGRAR